MERLLLPLQLLVLICAVNGAPILLRRVLRERLLHPVDGGHLWCDGRPLLGPRKTLVGLAVAVFTGLLLGWAFGLGWQVGLLMGGGAMLGDLISSFAKRRLKLPPSGQAPGLDQIPESLLPLLAVRNLLHLGWSEILLVVLAFVLLDSLISPLLYRLRIRNRPF
jgi:CDP-2,3-bis-(O-geranylgeranyl)-sn-glycerol synthase